MDTLCPRNLVKYTTNVKSISNKLSIKYEDNESKISALSDHYKSLNEASFAIKLRLNYAEDASKNIIQTMEKFEQLSKNDSDFVPKNIKPIEQDLVSQANAFLKGEWKRVKRGEGTFQCAKWGVLATAALLGGILAMQACTPFSKKSEEGPKVVTKPESKDWTVCTQNWAIRLAHSDDTANELADAVAYHCREAIQAATSSSSPPKPDQLNAFTERAKQRARLYVLWARSASKERLNQ